MLSRVRRAAVTGALVLALTGAGGLGALTPPAAADGCGRSGCGSGSDDGDSASTPTTSGHTVTVRVSGSFVGTGTSGSGGGSTTVSVPTPCYYFQVQSGKEYYDYVESGQAAALAGHTHEPFEPYPGYKSHKDDAEGHYYGGVCDSGNFDGDLDAFFAYAERWFADHGAVYVEAGGQPPLPPVPPEVLRDAALKVMTLPQPTFDYNPKAGGASSLVNLDTWFWLDDDVDTGSVTASAGPNSVTVSAVRTSVQFSSASAGSVGCADGGTPYSAGAQSSCTLVFQRATGPGGTPVTSTASWGLSWTYNGAAQGDLDPLTATDTGNVSVIEVQSLVDSTD